MERSVFWNDAKQNWSMGWRKSFRQDTNEDTTRITGRGIEGEEVKIKKYSDCTIIHYSEVIALTKQLIPISERLQTYHGHYGELGFDYLGILGGEYRNNMIQNYPLKVAEKPEWNENFKEYFAQFYNWWTTGEEYDWDRGADLEMLFDIFRLCDLIPAGTYFVKISW